MTSVVIDHIMYITIRAKGKQMKTIIATVAIATAGLVWAVDYSFSLPDVHMSYETGACVEVINYADTNFSCENMPAKFHHVWVK